jgi:arginase
MHCCRLPSLRALRRGISVPQGQRQLSNGIGLFGLCEDRNSSYQRGPKTAPPLIREQFYCDSSNTSSELSIDILPFLKDYGDFHPGSPDFKQIQQSVSGWLSLIHKEGRLPLILGGDHSITSSIVLELRKLIGQPIAIVHFDAHPDIYPLFLNNQSSHASPFARILEHPETCKKLITVGIRTATLEQREQWKKYDVVPIEARHFPAHG